MQARLIQESGDALPSQTEERQEIASPTSGDEGKAEKTVKKPRTKRPRPTFDDGAITRVFKFPSKTFPRSSYYVTSTEIIIRIKKARKKWRLTVPKKRVVSYRTNRWFAKPRWVELELTYTQAVKLALVEARTQTVDAVTPVALPLVVESPPMQDEASQIELPLVLEPEAPTSQSGDDADSRADECDDSDDDQQNGATGADEEEFSVDSDPESDSDYDIDPELDAGVDASADEDEAVVEQPVLVPAGDLVTDDSPVAASPPSQVPPQLDAVPIGLPQPLADRQPRRLIDRHAALLAASLLLVCLSTTAAWLMHAGELTPPQVAEATTCETAASCAHRIETGSIRKVEPPSALEPAPIDEPKAIFSPETEKAIEPREVIALEAPKADVRKSEPVELALAAPQDMPPPDPVVAEPVVVLKQEPVETEAVHLPSEECLELSAVGQMLSIEFDFASSTLSAESLAALKAFALQMQTCSSAKVVIEGHTDSDGHPDRNLALSLRRANAVREHLIQSGANANLFSVVGFGPSRPLAPNLSNTHKRSNRRAALVVQLPP